MFATTEQYVYLTNTELTDIDSVFFCFFEGKKIFYFFQNFHKKSLDDFATECVVLTHTIVLGD